MNNKVPLVQIQPSVKTLVAQLVERLLNGFAVKFKEQNSRLKGQNSKIIFFKGQRIKLKEQSFTKSLAWVVRFDCNCRWVRHKAGKWWINIGVWCNWQHTGF